MTDMTANPRHNIREIRARAGTELNAQYPGRPKRRCAC